MKTIKTNTVINKFSKVALALATIAITFSSCKKDELMTPQTEPEPVPEQVATLSSGNWVLESVNINGFEVKGSYIDECEQDDITVFKTNGTYVTDAGAIKCDPNDKQTTSGVWEFTNNYTKLVIDKEDAMHVTLLTKKELHVTDTTHEDGIEYITNMKFSSK